MTASVYFPFDQDGMLETKEDFKNYGDFIKDHLDRNFNHYMKQIKEKRLVGDDIFNTIVELLLTYERRNLHWKMMFARVIPTE